MRDRLTLLAALCMLQSIVGRAGGFTGPGFGLPILRLPERTPGMTSNQYGQAMFNEFESYLKSLTKQGRQEPGQFGSQPPFGSSWGSGRYPSSRPTGYGNPTYDYRPPSPPAWSENAPPTRGYKEYSVFFGRGGGRGNKQSRKYTYSYGGSGNRQPGLSSPPDENENSNDRYLQGRVPDSNYNWPPNPPSQSSLHAGLFNLLGPRPLGSPQPSPATAVPDYGGGGNSYDSKPSQDSILGSPSTVSSQTSPNAGLFNALGLPRLGSPQPSPTTAVPNYGGGGNSYDSKPSQDSILGSPSTVSSQPSPPAGLFNALGLPRLGSPQPSPATAVPNYGGGGNSYDSKPSQPATAAGGSYGGNTDSIVGSPSTVSSQTSPNAGLFNALGLPRLGSPQPSPTTAVPNYGGGGNSYDSKPSQDSILGSPSTVYSQTSPNAGLFNALGLPRLGSPQPSPTTAVPNYGGGGNSYDSKPSQDSILGSPSTVSSQTSPNAGPFNALGLRPLGSPQPSPTTAVPNYGGGGNSYDSKPSQPPTAGGFSHGDNPVSDMIGTQLLGLGGGQEGVGGGQQQATTPEPTPFLDPKNGKQAAEQIAIAMVDALRHVLNTEHRLSGKEQSMMNICEKAVANQQPAMREMKKSDKALIDVLVMWREKLMSELVNFYQNEAGITNAGRGSPELKSVRDMFGECLRPKLVLMKV